jgi:antitoxin ParD1/3/4
MSDNIITVSISGEEREFVAEQLAAGNYSDEADIVHAALSLLKVQQKLGTLRTLIAEGDADIAAGSIYEYETSDDFLSDITSKEFAD